MFARSSSPQAVSSVSSIFRFKAEEQGALGSYDHSLRTRYYENSNHLSWDVEENPPVASPPSASTKAQRSNYENDREKNKQANSTKQSELENKVDIETSIEKEETSPGDSTKTRYRCKLCGQPKQNHTCPYQKALQRNIGTMSYPALNAFQCKENGMLAPALSDMNNFVDLDNDFDNEQGEDSPEASNCDDSVRRTPATKRQLSSIQTPQDSDVQLSKGIWAKKRKTRRTKKGDKSKNYKGDDKLFHHIMDIRPEQYRLVSPRASKQMGNFRYPSLPLAFEQRKNASEDLFELSQQIAGLSEECAKVLQVARESNAWDLAVAELTAQVLVIMHCPLGDDVLNGLCRHLETIGISS